LGDRIFEIKYVEHEKPFYQLLKNYTYQLRCELFQYEDEVIWQTWDDINEENDVDLNADLFFEIVTTVFLDKIKDRWNEWEKLMDY
jgi:hypothetical protein